MRFVALLGAAALAAALAAPAAAQPERILDFDSRIVVAESGSMTVVETITAYAAGEKIKRGIYRDFPTIYDGPLGTRVEVPFQVVRVLRDGSSEAYHTERRENGVRVYIGRSDTMLPHGVHTFVLVYTTSRQIGFFADHDELYWNVTGNGWELPIEHASATVVLPEAVPRDRVHLEAYTGFQGARDRGYRSSIDPRGGDAHFETTVPLEARQGLTIVVDFPKGFVHEPTREEKWEAFRRSNAGLFVGAGGLLAVLLYYAIAWLLVGRDPRRGTIIPLFEPPLKMAPACVRYALEMGYDKRCFTAAVLDMAVKGVLRIDEEDGEYTLVRLSDDRSALSLDERRAAASLLTGERLKLTNAHHTTIQKAISSLREALKLQYEGKMFVANRRWVIPGMVLSVLAVIAAALGGPSEQVGPLVFILIWLSGWTFGVFALLRGVVQAWSAALRPGLSPLSKIGTWGAALFITAFSLPFVGGEAMGLYFMARMSSVWMPVLLLVLIGSNFLFFDLLKRPTRAGRALMDQIEGFRMYLATAEGDRLAQVQSPPRTPELFEKLLPYALALGVENEWSEKFSDVLAAAGRSEGGYQPAWYRGSAWSSLGAAGFASSMGSSFSSAIASSATAPGSSSGGGGSSGGGSSGGGGGGGGGGGW